jgi:hypothetical protein
LGSTLRKETSTDPREKDEFVASNFMADMVGLVAAFGKKVE